MKTPAISNHNNDQEKDLNEFDYCWYCKLQDEFTDNCNLIFHN